LIFASGQTCGQTVIIEFFAREHSAEKVGVYKAFRRFLLRDTLGAVSCSQTKRLTIRQHPEIFSFFSTMVKPVVKPLFFPPLDHDLLAFSPFFARLLAFLKTADENDCMLPNQAPYH